jgi:hypothetical protein
MLTPLQQDVFEVHRKLGNDDWRRCEIITAPCLGRWCCANAQLTRFHNALTL